MKAIRYIFGGLAGGDRVANGVVEAYKKIGVYMFNQCPASGNKREEGAKIMSNRIKSIFRDCVERRSTEGQGSPG